MEADFLAKTGEDAFTFALEVRESRIDGMGLFAALDIPAKRKLGEMSGKSISRREADRRAKGARRIAIVETRDGRAIDGSQDGNAFRFVNHSCSPNTFLRIIGVHVEFYALRRISAGEEITCDYLASHHDGRLSCRCGSVRCRGFL
ncbi:MAG TPA: SET domain-containing protein-lysine N-methyltransferase [Blastocatellia bacterium]|nr:SET domain-containing protein-lysine N-methyltransferase [Blastocatellia bacterium]